MDNIRRGEQFIKQFISTLRFSECSQVVAKFFKQGSSKSVVFTKVPDSRFPDSNLIEGGDTEYMMRMFFSNEITSQMSEGKWMVEFEISIQGQNRPIYKPQIPVFKIFSTKIQAI